MRTNTVLSIGGLILALLIALVWVPLDTDTGLIEKVRRRVSIGDALAPTVAAAFLGLGSVLLFLERNRPDQIGLSRANLRYLLLLVLAFVISFTVMRWLGPLAFVLVGPSDDPDLSYRVLRDTPPWKYLGYFFGTGFMVAALVSLLTGRIGLRAALTGAVAAAALILLFDVPFEDLILPPNGDV